MDLLDLYYPITLSVYIPTQIVSAFIFYQVFFGPNKNKFGSFYRLFALNFVLGLLFFLTDVLFARPAITITRFCDFVRIYFEEPSYILTPLYFSQYYLQFAKSFLCILVSANRMTAVVFPLRYHSLWRSYGRFSIFSVLILPFFFTFQVIFARATVHRFGYICTIDYVKYLPQVRNSLMSLIVNVIAFGCIFLCTIVTVYFLSLIKDRTRTAELQLVTVAAILGAGAVFNAVVQTYIYFVVTTPFTYIMKFCAIDITFICAPWSLFLMSPELRISICKKENNNNEAMFKRTSRVNTITGRE